MQVDLALLADAVTVREGLLHILGGGTNRLGREAFPAPLDVEMAIRVLVHPTEADDRHVLRALLLAEDGEQIGQVEIDFQVDDDQEGMRPGEEYAAVFALPLRPYPIPKPGAYSFEILIDGVHQKSVSFLAEEM